MEMVIWFGSILSRNISVNGLIITKMDLECIFGMRVKESRSTWETGKDSLKIRYVGEWKNGFRHGYGVFFYSNGGKYEGLWDSNYKHGFGIFTFHDGSQYVGKFHNDRMIDYNAQGLFVPVSLNKLSDNKSTTNLNNANNITKKVNSKFVDKAPLRTIRDDPNESKIEADQPSKLNLTRN